MKMKLDQNIIKPKAYFIDIDGTLVSGHKDRTLNIDDVHAIKNAIKNETYIVLSTGRSLPDLKKIWDQIDDGGEYTRYAIVNNGSGIWDMRRKEILSESYLDEETYRAAFEYAKERKFAIKNSSEKIFYVMPSLLSKVLNKFTSSSVVSSDFDSVPYDNEAAKKLGVITTYKKRFVSKVAKDLNEKLPKADIAISGPGLYIEINKAGVSKGTALEFIADRIGIDLKETVHIGDSMNDAPGFKSAGYGVAMGNSMKELKAMSDFITLDRKKAGVANTIRSFGNA